MKFNNIKSVNDLIEFTKINQDNFTLEIKSCEVTRANGFANFNILITMDDYVDTVLSYNITLNIAHYLVAKLSQKRVPIGSYYSLGNCNLDSTFLYNLDECLVKKIKEYKKTPEFLEAHEEFIINQAQGIIEYEFESRRRQLNKFGYSTDQIETLFNKIIRRISIKKLLE